jgi:SAM-dependent methyltransferase
LPDTAVLVAPSEPAPSATEPSEAPREATHRPDQHNKLSLWFESVAQYIDVFHPPAGAKVLDYGCGPGRVLDRLKPAGWSTFGIEPALKSTFTRHTELVDPPAEPTFSLVIVHHVLEHLLNPLDVLKQIAASMVDGGIIYISVPRLDAIDRHGDLRYCINSHGHVMSYTRECMTALLAMAGLTAIDVKNDAELDRLLTSGDPRRLRVFARKSGTPTVPANPLAGAERALREYRARFEPKASRAMAAVPVRLRASWLHRSRTATVLAHRSQKLSALRAGGSGAR